MRKQFDFEKRDDVLRRDQAADFAPAVPAFSRPRPARPTDVGPPTAAQQQAQATGAPRPPIMRDVQPQGPMTAGQIGLAARDVVGETVNRMMIPARAAGAVFDAVAEPTGQFLGGLMGNPGPPAAQAPSVTRPMPATPAQAAIQAPAAAQPAAPAPAAPQAPAGAVSATGRQLGYGQQIDGVQVFSDGSGGGGVPRTMSDEQIAGLAQGNRVTPVASVVPTQGQAASMVAGGTPELGDGPSIARQRYDAQVANAQAVNRATFERATRNDAMQRLNDTTTPEGKAFAMLMRNPNTRSKREAITNLINQASGAATQFDRTVADRGAASERTAADTANAALGEAGATERTRMATDAQLQGQGSLQTGADGGMYLVRGGQASPVTAADGQQFRPAVDDSRRAARIDKIKQDLAESTADFLPPGVDPTGEQITAARMRAAKARGLKIVQGEDGKMFIDYGDGETEEL